MPLGGICLSGSFEVMAAMSGDLAELPGRTALPLSPPASNDARSFMLKLPFFLSPVWHSPQCSRRMGTIWWEKSTFAGAAANVAEVRLASARAEASGSLNGMAKSIGEFRRWDKWTSFKPDNRSTYPVRKIRRRSRHWTS